MASLGQGTEMTLGCEQSPISLRFPFLSVSLTLETLVPALALRCQEVGSEKAPTASSSLAFPATEQLLVSTHFACSLQPLWK